MKNATDYIREDGPGRTSITSLAYWLTPEGLSSPITAAMLREAIATSTDNEFIKAFDGATKDEAREYLAAYELCAMPYWGAEELATAIHAADVGRSKELALRAATLAQIANELPDAFTPKQGIEWAMDRGYLFGEHARFVGAAMGTYGHPHNPLSDGPHHATAPPAPVVAGASGEWTPITSLARAPGYRWPLYQFIKAAHIAGKPCPKAREFLEWLKTNPDPELQVMPDGLKYNNGAGKRKEAGLKAIQQVIKGLLQPPTKRQTRRPSARHAGQHREINP